jgi:hypothetical protein
MAGGRAVGEYVVFIMTTIPVSIAMLVKQKVAYCRLSADLSLLRSKP